MPFCDTERFLRESIESVLAQTYSDWELLLVDDGSADGSTEIASEYAACEPRISYLAHPSRKRGGQTASSNLGIAPSRNLGIAQLIVRGISPPHDAVGHAQPARLRFEILFEWAVPDDDQRAAGSRQRVDRGLQAFVVDASAHAQPQV